MPATCRRTGRGIHGCSTARTGPLPRPRAPRGTPRTPQRPHSLFERGAGAARYTVAGSERSSSSSGSPPPTAVVPPPRPHSALCDAAASACWALRQWHALKQHCRETTPKAKITINSRRIPAMVRMLPNAMAWERGRGRDAGVVRVCCWSEKLLGSPSICIQGGSRKCTRDGAGEEDED